MNIAYDQNTTIQSLKSLGALEEVFDIITNEQTINDIQKDFEIKRLVIGLSTIALSTEAANVDPSL